VADMAKYKILHTYTVDGEPCKKEYKGIFYITQDYKVVYAEAIE
jgi:hypothetical protein